MRKKPAYTNSSPPRRALVYRLVFEHALMRMFVLLLLCSFSLQTVERALASEEVPSPTPESIITITDETVSVLTEEVSDRTESPTQVVTPAEPVAEESTVLPIVSDTSGTVADPSSETSSYSTESADEISPDVSADTVTVEAETAPAEGEDTPASTPSPVTDDGLSTTSHSTSTDPTASTTEESVPTLTVESDQMIQFEKTNCLAVEDGSFYCQMATTTTPQAERGLFALPDADGDLEIYVKNGDEMSQITFNTVDDASPYYDPASDSIVWHRMIDERYQIVIYDVASAEETQLTDTSTNNMEPFRADDKIVWQHWDNDAWQIMLYNGGSIEQLTATGEHNLAPVIRNNLVVWHRVMYGEKTIEVYDLTTKAFMTIRDTEGGTITNPRMVLVYDAAMDNGDTVTRGYDLVTGEISSFATESAPVPDDIPEPDATGETRALLNTKTASEEEGLEDLGVASSSDTQSPSLDTQIASSSGLTLDLTVASSTTTAAMTVETSVPIPDLVVTPY